MGVFHNFSIFNYMGSNITPYSLDGLCLFQDCFHYFSGGVFFPEPCESKRKGAKYDILTLSALGF